MCVYIYIYIYIYSTVCIYIYIYIYIVLWSGNRSINSFCLTKRQATTHPAHPGLVTDKWGKH